MLGKIIMLLMIYMAIWFADRPRMKKLGGREFAAYTAMLLLSLYLSIDYAWDLKWPFIEDAALYLLGEPAKLIVKLLTIPS